MSTFRPLAAAQADRRLANMRQKMRQDTCTDCGSYCTGIATPIARNAVASLVVAIHLIVYCWSSAAADPVTKTPPLPPNVAEMRELILSAVRSGRIEDLKAAIELNANRPDFGTGEGDPVQALSALSGDGQGREILAALGEIFDMPPAALPLGRDLENNLIYIWPYLAARPLDQLTGPEEVDLYRLIPPAKLKEMREKKRWTWWRLAIGADGTWLAFKKQD